MARLAKVLKDAKVAKVEGGWREERAERDERAISCSGWSEQEVRAVEGRIGIAEGWGCMS